MQGRRLCSAVFLTFQFDPGFFEQEVLPVFLDVPLSHATAIRLVQLEDALRAIPGQVAVYYDAHGLVAGEAGSAKLDVHRIAVRHRTGIFHPKNVFLLVEDEVPDEAGHRAQTLIVASLSANLTRSGWWENVECCHVEEINEGEKTRLKEDIVNVLQEIRRKTPAETEHGAMRDLRHFLKSTDQRQRKSSGGRLHARLYSGPESVVDFLAETVGAQIHGSYLEIIAPYLDDAVECKPLQDLLERFEPKAVRLYLPRSPAGEVLCRQEVFRSVAALPNVAWGRLAKDFLRLGRHEDAGERSVHAKIYRFFTQSPKREICFIGSVNLTSAAHQVGGNFETGFLVDYTPQRRPDFWLTPDDRPAAEFRTRGEGEAAASGGRPLNLRYNWDRNQAEAFWDAPSQSPELHLEARGVAMGMLNPLPPREWGAVEPELTRRIGEVLAETSLFEVYDGTSRGLLLVQELGMSHKPSLLFRLSAADILRYWSLLTPDQRAAFLEARAPEIALLGQGADLVARAKMHLEEDTVFDRFAGFFHAFGCLERTIRTALTEGKEKEATYRLFGQKYDSLGPLLDRIASESGTGDGVDHYVLVSCARQLCQEVTRDHSEYWEEHADDAKALDARVGDLHSAIRSRLAAGSPEEFGEFLQWFDRWFLVRAVPVGGEDDD